MIWGNDHAPQRLLEAGGQTVQSRLAGAGRGRAIGLPGRPRAHPAPSQPAPVPDRPSRRVFVGVSLPPLAAAAMADEEVNPQIEVEESCKPQCVKAWLEYQASGVVGPGFLVRCLRPPCCCQLLGTTDVMLAGVRGCLPAKVAAAKTAEAAPAWSGGGSTNAWCCPCAYRQTTASTVHPVHGSCRSPAVGIQHQHQQRRWQGGRRRTVGHAASRCDAAPRRMGSRSSRLCLAATVKPILKLVTAAAGMRRAG